MRNRYITEECNKILNFWKLEEYFTPSDYPELTLTIKEGKQDIPFDAYYNAYSTRSLPLKEYKAHNEYLRQKHKSDEKLYNRANVYCGCYKIKTFVEKMAEKCKLDMEKYAEINELSGRFYIFSVQIDLDGKLTEEGVQISPFFYAVLCMIKSEGINVNIMQEDICKLNEDVNELLKQNDIQILEFTDITIVKNIVFDKLGVENESQVGLEGASDKVYACKGLKKEDETSDFFSFYLDEIERVQKNYKNNEHVIKYTTALLSDNQKKIMIDSDVNAMKKWLEVDKFPLAKYPSKFSPTLMQQLAINIAVSEKDRNEKIFSVNGPPGTGKTTLTILSKICKTLHADFGDIVEYVPDAEIWDLYNENRELLGKDHVRGEQLPIDRYHLVVHVWIRNSKGEYLISQRSANRPTYPLMWECVGGSVVKGEDSLLGAIREAKEEVGVDLMPENGQVLFTKTRKIIEGKIFNDIMDVWLFEYDGEVDLGNATTDEVAQVAWMNREQIKELFEQEVFVGTLEYFFTEVDKERR